MAEIEKTCENCKWEEEEYEGSHCRHCIHSAEERFEPKEVNKKCIAEIKIDMDMLQKVIEEKIKEFKADIQAVRNAAIDEFAEKLCDKVTDDSLQVMLPDGLWADVVTLDYATEIACEIAEQMKGGANEECATL